VQQKADLCDGVFLNLKHLSQYILVFLWFEYDEPNVDLMVAV